MRRTTLFWAFSGYLLSQLLAASPHVYCPDPVVHDLCLVASSCYCGSRGHRNIFRCLAILLTRLCCTYSTLLSPDVVIPLEGRVRADDSEAAS